MIAQKELLNKLKEFGLNSYEGKLWIALLSRGVSTAGELSDISNVPRSRAYDVLESLEKKGFIVVKVGKPIKYLAVQPHEVIERVKKKITEEAKSKSEILNNLKDSPLLDELNALHTDGIKLVDPTDKSASFRGRAKVYDHLGFLVKNAKKSIHVKTTKEGMARKYEVLAKHFQKAASRGVNITLSVPANAKKEAEKLFGDVATIKAAKDGARFCVVDEKNILVFLTDDAKIHESYDSAVWLEAPHFASYLHSLME